MTRQIPLSVSLPDSAGFENFYPARNEQLLAALRECIGIHVMQPTSIYLYGEAGCGKTHLLYASVRLTRDLEGAASYIPLHHWPAEALNQLDGKGLVCVDGLDAAAGGAAVERALFRLYERCQAGAGVLLIAARAPPGQVGLGLDDLISRLHGGAVYHVASLNDLEKREALRMRAANRGLQLTDEVARYVLRRYPRDTHALFGLLDRIDVASLSEQRRITIPFLQKLGETPQR